MTSPATSSAALPLAHLVLRMLIILNWAVGAGILAMLFILPTREWLMSSLDLSPSPEADRVVLGFRTIAVIGVVLVPLNYAALTRLLAIVETVRSGDAFVPVNAVRLQTIAWVLLAMQLLSIVIGAIAKRISTPGHPVHMDAGFSINGWLAVLLTFLLARVFAEGTRMRDDLHGTV